MNGPEYARKDGVECPHCGGQCWIHTSLREVLCEECNTVLGTGLGSDDREETRPRYAGSGVVIGYGAFPYLDEHHLTYDE